MKTDLDRLMADRKLDAAVILGPDGLGGVNANFNYFVGGRHIIGHVFKKRGNPAVLVHGTMERDAAAETGLELINVNRWPAKEIAKQFPEPFAARVELFRRMLTDLQITGRVGFYGTAESGATFALLRELEAKVPGLTVVGEGHRDLVQTARETKDDAEIAAMAEVGIETCALVGDVREFLRSHAVRDETLVGPGGRPLTVGDVKLFARNRMIVRNLEHTGDFIFSVGRDAGVPHNHGNNADVLKLGRSIIFDIYPRRHAGYYHDMTRTWCLGYAPPEVAAAYRDVYDCFHAMVARLAPNVRTYSLQHATCDFFESRGHATIRQDPKIDQGYIHSLGHGLGLDIHEQPFSPTHNDTGAEIAPGATYTVEPGLYYPARGFGVRIEDTYVCGHDGKFRSLTPFQQDLVVPMG